MSSDLSDLGIVLTNADPIDADLIHFRDGVRRIDYVLVYEEQFATANSNSSEDSTRRARLKKHESYRAKFLSNLRQSGLDMEEELVRRSEPSQPDASSNKSSRTSSRRQRNVQLYFIKLSAPWDVLISWAEELGLRAPLQAHSHPVHLNGSKNLFEFCHTANPFEEHVPNAPLDYYTCPFKKSKIDRFLGSDNRDEYFSPTQRIKVVHEILNSTVYGKRKKAQIGIDRLIEEGVYLAAYPLHDGPFKNDSFYVDPRNLNKRQVLYEYWARWSKWYKYQPLDNIREYFGEKIAMYFAWLGKNSRNVQELYF